MLTSINLPDQQGKSVNEKSHVTAPWFEMPANNADAEVIHFAGANGFPIATYQEFFDSFAKQYKITGMDCRATWLPKTDPPNNFSIDDFADDLINAIETQHKQPVIGLGHSHGGLMTLVAAAKRPELFSKLVIIEPAAFPNPWMAPVAAFAPKWLMYRLVPFIKGSLERQTIWSSPDAFYQRYHGHPTFKRFTDRSLRDYAEHGLRKLDDGTYELIFNPAWEAHIFCTLKVFWNYLEKQQTPTLILRAEHSNLNTKQSFIRNKKRINQLTTLDELQDSYHLFTHEKPQQTQQKICDWLSNKA